MVFSKKPKKQTPPKNVYISGSDKYHEIWLPKEL